MIVPARFLDGWEDMTKLHCKSDLFLALLADSAHSKWLVLFMKRLMRCVVPCRFEYG